MVIKRKAFSEKFESSFERALKEKNEKENFERETRESGKTPWIIAPGKENEFAAEEKVRAAAEAKKEEDLKKGALAAAGVAAVGTAGYAAYKAWKKRQAKKKDASSQAEEKFKK